MKILAIDTSGQTAGAAVVDDCITIGELNINTQKRMTHSEILLPMIDTLFHLTGLSVNDMDFIACVNGPGSFTGLRIGAATAEGLARGAGKGLVPVPALDALAYNVGCAANPGTLVVPMMDARRTQVYTAVYRCDGLFPERVSDYQAISVTEALSVIAALQPEGRVIFLGDGASAYEDALSAADFSYTFAPANDNRQRAASVGACAIRRVKDTEGMAENFSLLYIRKPQAERVRLGEDA